MGEERAGDNFKQMVRRWKRLHMWGAPWVLQYWDVHVLL